MMKHIIYLVIVCVLVATVPMVAAEDTDTINSAGISSNHTNADIDTIFDASTVVNCNVPQYSQRDPEWKDDRLGYANNPDPGTIEYYGCALTSTAMVFKYYGVDVTPKSLNNWLISNNGYNDYDSINWYQAVDFSDNILSLYFKNYISELADLSKINSYLDAGRPVIAHVNLYDSNAPGGTHFVVITGYEDNNVYILNDPWDGQIHRLNENCYATKYNTAGSAYEPTNRIWGIRVYSGEKTTIPNPPTPISPGIITEPGITIDTLTPTLQWSASEGGADYYSIYVSKYPYGSSNLVIEQNFVYGTSWTIPIGKLVNGEKYRWNMQAHKAGTDSEYSEIRLHFQTNVNTPPNTPSTPYGDTNGVPDTLYAYVTSATDPDGDQVKYTFDWGDGKTSETTLVSSGSSKITSHSWSSEGTYLVKAKATDSNGASSGWSNTLTVTINSENTPPNTPTTPYGDSNGIPGNLYAYVTSATDPDGDQVKYTFDWGDGKTSETTLVNSGSSKITSHSWSSEGTYLVKAKATDSNGATSGWSNTLTVKIEGENNPSDSETWEVIETIQFTEDKMPIAVAISGSKAYVGSDPAGLAVIDLETNEIIKTISFSSYPGARPGYIDFSGNKAYIALSNLGSNGQLAVINTDDDTLSTYIPAGCNPWGVATLNDKIFVTNNVQWTNGDPATVSVINANTNSVTASIPVGINPICIGINPTTRRAYVSNVNDLSKSVSVINTDTNSVVATIPMDNPPKAIAIVDDYAYVTAGDWQRGMVEIIDTKTNQIVSSIQVGKQVVGIAKSDKHVFVTNQYSNTISVINTSTNNVISVVEVGQNPTYVAFDPLTCRIFVTNQGDKTISIIGQRENIIEAPVASFTANSTAGYPPISVQFTDISTGDPTAWDWNFGDGAISTEQHPVHTYTSAGNYTVSLTVTNDGGSDTLTVNNYIEVSYLPVATSNVTTFPSSSTLSVGETQEFTIALDNVTDGLSGFNITADLLPWSPDGPSPEPPVLSALTSSTTTDVCEMVGVTYPSWAGIPMNSSFPTDQAFVKAVDIQDLVKRGAKNVTLCTLTICGDAPGTAVLRVTARTVDDDAGGRYEPTFVYASLTVQDALPFPNPSGGDFPYPTDPDGDGLYEDLDGNGFVGFNDVVIYYQNMNFIESKQPLAAFDYDGSGFVGFNDVVILYRMV